MQQIELNRLSDGAVNYGNGVIGPSIADQDHANSQTEPLVTSGGLSNIIFEAGALGATAVAVVACSPSQPTEAPTQAPEFSVAPSFTIEPTPTPQPTPTPEPTPTRTPEPTLIPVANLFEGKAVKPDVKEVTSEIKAVLADNPNAVDPSGNNGWTQQVYLNNWKYCQTGDPTWSGDLNAEKESACRITVFKMMSNYIEFKDPKFYEIAKEVTDYAKTTLPKYNFNIFKEYIISYFPDA